MKDRSNVRSFLPKSEAMKLLTVLQEVSRAFSAPQRNLLADRLTTNQAFDGQLPDHRACSADAEARPSGTADDYNATDDFAKSIDEAYRVIRERMRNGGPGWTQKDYKR